MKKDLSIYIHIPFCYSKCYYCDFNSYADKDQIQQKYVDYLKREIDLYGEKFKDYKLKTVFFGGGTPSLIDKYYIKDILKHLYETIDTSELLEVSIEANPKTLTREKLETYKSVGVNRISIGVQTLDDKLLRSIGRSHTAKDFYDTYKMVKDCGFENINVDIMFNLPTQTIGDVLETLEKIAELDIPHISFYSLKLEEGTKLFDMFEKGEIELSDEDTERTMYHKGIEFLNTKGYELYEISNFAKEGYECIHNLTYWKLKPYLGLGLSSHSNIETNRYGNLEDFSSYFKSIDKYVLPIDQHTVEFIDKDMEMAEYVMLGLRLKEGVNKDIFKNRFDMELEQVFKGSLDKFLSEGLIVEEEGNLTLTDKGLDLCNLIFMEILPE